MKEKEHLKNDLRCLANLQYLREDNLFLLKVCNFLDTRQAKIAIYNKFVQLQNQRKIIQDQIIIKYQQTLFDVNNKASLYLFNGKITKVFKLYQNRLYNFAPNISQMCEISIFLKDIRQRTLQAFGQEKYLGSILQIILQMIRQKFNKQSQKIMYQNYRQQWIKNHKYLEIIKNGYLNSAIKYFQKATEVFGKSNNYFNTQYEQHEDILDIHQDCVNYHLNQIKQEGFCDFILGKGHRIMKQLKNKNIDNQKFIEGYRKKHAIVSIKNQQPFKKPRRSLFRIQPSNTGINNNRSVGVRPASQSNQNRTHTLRQTLMQIPVDEKVFITKALRIKKRMPLVLIRANNEKSLFQF